MPVPRVTLRRAGLALLASSMILLLVPALPASVRFRRRSRARSGSHDPDEPRLRTDRRRGGGSDRRQSRVEVNTDGWGTSGSVGGSRWPGCRRVFRRMVCSVGERGRHERQVHAQTTVPTGSRPPWAAPTPRGVCVGPSRRCRGDGATALPRVSGRIARPIAAGPPRIPFRRRGSS